MTNAKEIAKLLLEKKAVKLNTKEPFTYASGIRSPIYCDNRQMIAYPQERETIVDAFIDVVKKMDYDVIAGTSTAGIPWASWIAKKLNKPMAYIRGGKKDHGAGKQIEGADVNCKRIVIIEDLVSTGGSSFSAVEAARDKGGEVVAMVAIFTYEMEKAKKKFEEGKCNAIYLSNFSTLVEAAKDLDYISADDLKIALEWNKAPAEWGLKHGFPNAQK